MAKTVDVNGWDVGPSICAESLDQDLVKLSNLYNRGNP
jgi:hypothetical protein